MAPWRPAKRGTKTAPARRSAAPRSDPAEAGLLGLARELAALAAEDGGAPALGRALDRLAEAFRPAAPLPRALAAAAGRASAHKAVRLALAWAREQVRLSLGELLERARAAGRVRSDVAVETLAWLLLAGFEALAHEPPEARPDRGRALAALLGGADARLLPSAAAGDD
jgi:hypothetical protein